MLPVTELSREAALADLLANPAGSIRIWAARWGWTIPRVHRFLRSLERDKVMTFERSKAGTQTVTPPSEQTVTPLPDRNTCYGPESGLTPETTVTPPFDQTVTPCHLESLDLNYSRGDLERYTKQLIAEMNRVLGERFGEHYDPVSGDNFGSHRAGKAWEAAGIPLGFALERLAQDCRQFTPDKHGQGQLPKSLGLFTRGMLREWGRRAQLELGIPPKLVVLPNSAINPMGEGRLAPVADGIASFMAAFEEGQRLRGRG